MKVQKHHTQHTDNEQLIQTPGLVTVLLRFVVVVLKNITSHYPLANESASVAAQVGKQPPPTLHSLPTTNLQILPLHSGNLPLSTLPLETIRTRLTTIPRDFLLLDEYIRVSLNPTNLHP
jgi:hypothetical protein